MFATITPGNHSAAQDPLPKKSANLAPAPPTERVPSVYFAHVFTNNGDATRTLIPTLLHINLCAFQSHATWPLLTVPASARAEAVHSQRSGPHPLDTASSLDYHQQHDMCTRRGEVGCGRCNMHSRRWNRIGRGLHDMQQG
jgi:hypothetical protein